MSRRPAVSLLEAVEEKPQRGQVLVHLPDLLFAPAAYEWETAYFHKVVSVPCVVTLTQKEFGRPASSGERNPNEDRANTPRRAPRSRHRNSKLSATPPNAPGTGLVDQADAASGAPPPAYGLGVAAPLPARAWSPALSSEAPSVSSIDASPPPRRCATRAHRRAARREEDGGGRPPCAASVPRQRRHREGWRVVRREQCPLGRVGRGRQQSYPVSRLLAHRLRSSHQRRLRPY